jgi:hypothetical protein
MVPPVALEMSRGRVCDVRVEVRPHFATPPCEIEERGGGGQRGTGTRVGDRRPDLVVSRRRRAARRGSRMHRITPRAAATLRRRRGANPARGKCAADLQTRAQTLRRRKGVGRTRPARWVFSRKLLSSVDMSLRLSEAFSLRFEARYSGGQWSFVRFPRSPNRARVRFSSRQGALSIARDR